MAFSALIRALCLVSILGTSVLSAPSNGYSLSPRGVAIPLPPSDPPAPAEGDGAGPYNSKDASLTDKYVTKPKFYTIAAAADALGLDNAAANMRHYLGNSGDTLYEKVETMLGDMPEMSTLAQSLVQNSATAALTAISGASGEKTFSSSWSSFYATKAISTDWFFALGGFSVSVTGVVNKAASGNTVKYKIHVFDRYNWDTGKSVTIGPWTFEDKELGELHLKGLAREYIVRGSSAENVASNWKAGSVIPPPSTGGRD